MKKSKQKREPKWQVIWIADGWENYRTFDTYEQAADFSRKMQMHGFEVLALNQV